MKEKLEAFEKVLMVASYNDIDGKRIKLIEEKLDELEQEALEARKTMKTAKAFAFTSSINHLHSIVAVFTHYGPSRQLYGRILTEIGELFDIIDDRSIFNI